MATDAHVAGLNRLFLLLACLALVLPIIAEEHREAQGENELEVSEPPPRFPDAPPPAPPADCVETRALGEQQPIAGEGTSEVVDEAGDFKHVNKIMFKTLYELRRKAHKDIMQRLVKMGKYELQYKAIDELSEKMFFLIAMHKIKLENLTQIASDDNAVTNTTSTDIMEAMSGILENVALFSDIVYRLPDMTRRLLKTRQKWNSTIHWAYDYANKSRKLLDKPSTKIIYLAAQELNIVERSKKYVNPYSQKPKSKDQPKKEKKEKRKKEPKITKVEL